MKHVTNEYRKAVTSNREFLYEARITFSDGSRLTLCDKNDLMGDGISITSATSGTDSFDIGAAVMGELVLTLNNSTEKFDRYNFLDAQISLKIGLKLDSTVEYLQMGIYTVEEAKSVETTVILSALDRMSWFERDYSTVTSTYPRQLYWIVKDICDCCGVPFAGTSFPGGEKVVKDRPESGEISCLQMISYAAQAAGCYAVITGEGRLAFKWYDTSVFEEMDRLDGGWLKHAETGDDADGGSFADYGTGSMVDGGSFMDQRRYAHIYAMGSMQVATDEIVITGIRVASYEEEAKDEVEGQPESAGAIQEDAGFLYGEEGYVLLISENPLINKEMEKPLAEELGRKITGMKIRTFAVSALSDPSIEAGDCAYISDRKGNSYPVYITNVMFKLGNYEEFSCGALSPSRNRMDHTMAETMAVIRTKKEIKKQLTAYDTAVQQLTDLMANSFGVFKTEDKQPDGSVVIYMHDKPAVAESETIWKMASGAIAVSTDGGKTWNAGVTAEGNMVVKVLSAMGINADWINAGEISTATINIKDGCFAVDSNGNVKITKGAITIGEDAFAVDSGGNVTIKRGSINIGNGCFAVDSNGNMVSNNAEIAGRIVGRNGFSVEYVNTNNTPSTKHDFVFAKVGYKNPSGTGLSKDAFLNICSPHGTPCIVMGIGGYGEDPDDPFKLKDTAFFPNGAVISDAFIESLEQTLVESEKIENGNEWVSLKIRNSGAFVCVYGTYHASEQKAGEVKEITIGEAKSLHVPTYAPVRTVGMSGKRVFIFQISMDGKFTARNASELDYSSDSTSGIKFRFDFFRF